MSMVLIWVGLRRLVERQMAKRKRTSLEYLILGTLCCVLAAAFKYPNRAFLTRARPDLKKKTIRGLPLIGNLHEFVIYHEDQLEMLHHMFQIYGDVVSLTIPVFGRGIVINTPELMEYVLKTNFDNYVKGEIFRQQLTDILGRGIFVSDGDEWRFHRKTASNIFTTKFYRSLVRGAFRASADDLCTVIDTHIACDQPIDLQGHFLKLTLDAFGKLTFGIDFGALAQPGIKNEFGDAFDFLTAAADSRISNPFWPITDRLIPGRWKKHWGCIHTLHRYAAQAVSARRAETPAEKEARQRDLLDHFISYTNDDGSILTDLELKDVFVNFLVAGRDTTAQGLTWQFYSLMANPRVMRNLVQEIDHVLKGSTENMTYEVLQNGMPYAKAVFHETLRLHPPVPKNIKQAVADDVLPDGTRVYAGDFIGYSNWCMGRNKTVWGEDAEQFVPERWLVPDPENRASFGKFKPESQYKFVSFNAGPRLCLGQQFAILEALVTTCALLQRYHFRLTPNHPVPQVKGSVTLPMKKPLMAIVSRRTDGPVPASIPLSKTTEGPLESQFARES
ncbi:hypothetical protein MVEG_12359 [Podila verticillata NRRL 6337]|uniref:Cytochrome P450 oxidoreductase n=1 Tax=Podila verticillata NRRL 6337 TaxID=1069443 RepID=A0A086TIS4_9FUNG|nr:hypothetical protein MVEG_12359 [Podila verticillata NRRL 6337]